MSTEVSRRVIFSNKRAKKDDNRVKIEGIIIHNKFWVRTYLVGDLLVRSILTTEKQNSR